MFAVLYWSGRRFVGLQYCSRKGFWITVVGKRFSSLQYWSGRFLDFAVL